MRLLLILLLPILLLVFSSSQIAFASPRATPEQCNSWAQKIEKYNDKRRKGGSLKKMESYRDKVDNYKERRRQGRCRARYNG